MCEGCGSAKRYGVGWILERVEGKEVISVFFLTFVSTAGMEHVNFVKKNFFLNFKVDESGNGF